MYRIRMMWFTVGLGVTAAAMSHFIFKDLLLDRHSLSSQLKQQFHSLDSRLSSLESPPPQTPPLPNRQGPFKPKTTEGDDKPESQWTQDEKRMVNQDQRFKNIIISCLPYDIMESVISCETAKASWSDLVHIFEGPSVTKKNKIMDLKLEYQTFRAEPSETLLQTYTRYKTLLNELANDGVTLSKHEINVGFVKSLLEKWPNFSQGLRNVNINFQENLDDEADERSSEEHLRDLDLEFHERALLANSKCDLTHLEIINLELLNAKLKFL
ncbi:hypothetical protein Tco_0467735 [Tanacetum coccineum]